MEFNRERCVWEFQGAETELWKLPPDPLLEAVAKVLTPEQPEWSGTPTELLERLSGVSIQANILTRKLNVSADRLYNDYGIRYESVGHALLQLPLRHGRLRHAQVRGQLALRHLRRTALARDGGSQVNVVHARLLLPFGAPCPTVWGNARG